MSNTGSRNVVRVNGSLTLFSAEGVQLSSQPVRFWVGENRLPESHLRKGGGESVLGHRAGSTGQSDRQAAGAGADRRGGVPLMTAGSPRSPQSVAPVTASNIRLHLPWFGNSLPLGASPFARHNDSIPVRSPTQPMESTKCKKIALSVLVLAGLFHLRPGTGCLQLRQGLCHLGAHPSRTTSVVADSDNRDFGGLSLDLSKSFGSNVYGRVGTEYTSRSSGNDSMAISSLGWGFTPSAPA